MDLLFRDEVYQIVGAAMEVHNELGAGFLEAVYQEAMELELKDRDIPSVAKPLLKIYYKDNLLQKKYEPDLLCFGEIIVEMKAMKSMSGNEEAQILNYVKASRKRLGVLINFGSPEGLDWKRYIR